MLQVVHTVKGKEGSVMIARSTGTGYDSYLVKPMSTVDVPVQRVPDIDTATVLAKDMANDYTYFQ